MLAGLAPLLGLWAVGATLATNPETAVQRQISPTSLQHLFQPIVTSLLILAAERASVGSSRSAASHAVLTLGALSATPFRGSLFLLNSQQALNLHARRHLHASLRC